MGETHFGGYAAEARVKPEWLVPLPAPFSTRDAMAIGTAGYTAMLSVMALEEEGVAPGTGPVIVTGAAGGVGSVAIALLAKRGHEVVAATGRVGEADYLKRLGAAEIMDRAELSGDAPALGRARWAGAVDAVGSKILANVLATAAYGGVVTACGLAGGRDLPTTVLPFILRGVKLVGIDSVMCPKERRLEAWQRLASEFDLSVLHEMTTEIPLSEIRDAAARILEGQIRGRVVVDVAR